MKIRRNYIAFTKGQHRPKRPGKNKNSKLITRFPLALLLLFSLSITLYGCGKPSNNPLPIVANPTGCAIASDVDEALGIRNFEYDDKGFLVKMTGPNYYYGPFVRTITPTEAIDAYPSASVDGNGNHYYGNINLTYNYSGGSGNIYDGNPQFMHYLFVATSPPSSMRTDSMYQFLYDDEKKHLTSVLMPGSGYQDAEGFTYFRTELNFAYDANDNVSQAKIIYDYERKVTVNPSPGEDRIDYKQVSDELLTITYDDKPSPYTAISKYWKFIGQDLVGLVLITLINSVFGQIAVPS